MLVRSGTQGSRLRRAMPWIGGAALVILVVACMAGAVLTPRIEPMLRARIVNTFGERFGSAVALDSLHVHFDGGFQVEGRGLRVQSVLHGVPGDPAHPMLSVAEFRFHVGLLTAISDSPRIHHVRIRGVQLDLPATAAQPGAPVKSKHEVDLEYAEVDDAHIRFAGAESDRAPLLFDLPHLELRGVSRSRPIRYKARVDNGVPIGITETEGIIGPWNFDDPRLTPIEGTFAFANRDVSGVRGLRGSLSLQGRYRGRVGSMHAEGTTDDPRFALDVSSRATAMHTQFAFTLDAVHGDIRIERLQGTFGKTTFVCVGDAVKNRAPEGFRLDLKLDAPEGRVEDVLALATHTSPAVLRGGMALHGRLRMSAGAESVSRKLSMDGASFVVSDARFSNPGVQQVVDQLAERARGTPEDADTAHATAVTAAVRGTVQLRDAELRFAGTNITMPGAQAVVSGTYALNGTQFVFDGSVHTDAKLSHMTGGFKSLVLKPFNGLFQHGHNQSGATLPLHIEGVGDVPHFETKIAGLKVTAPGSK